MKYTPSPIPTNFPADVRAWLGDELRRISAALNGVDNVRLKTQGAEPSKYADGDIVYADGTSWNPGDGEGMYVREAGAWVKTGAGAGGGATELSGLSDVNTSTPTNRNALMADGVDWESRALVEADISDLGSYTESAANETITGSWTFKGTLEVEHSASTDYGRFYHTGSDFIIEASPPPTTNYFKMTNSRS